MFPSIHGVVSQVSQRSYATILRDDYGASEVWPLVDIASGVTIPAFVNSSYDGTLSGWDLQNAAGPVAGTLAPYIDNDFANVNTAALGAELDPDEVAWAIWLRASSAAMWTDGNIRIVIRIRMTSADIFAALSLGNGNARIFAPAFTQFATTSAAWQMFGGRRSLSNDSAASFVNGSSVATETGLSSLGAQTLTRAALGGDLDNFPASTWQGWLAYVAFWTGSGNLPTDGDFAAMYAAAATAGAD